MRRLILAAFVAALFAGQAAAQDLPIGAGVSRDFEAAFDPVRQAARQTIQNEMPGMLNGASEVDGNYVFSIHTPISPLAWGQDGQVIVMVMDDDTTRVVLHLQRRSRPQMSGRTERRLAEQLFDGIERRLARPQ